MGRNRKAGRSPVAAEPRKRLSKAIRNFCALHSLIPERIGHGVYAIWRTAKMIDIEGTVRPAKVMVTTIESSKSDSYNIVELEVSMDVEEQARVP